MTTTQAPGGATVAQRWLARLAMVAAAAAVLVAPLAAGLRQSITLVLVGLAGLALTLAGALTDKGLVRGLAIALAVAAPLTVLILYTRGAEPVGELWALTPGSWHRGGSRRTGPCGTGCDWRKRARHPFQVILVDR
jgi:hypothetical protein